MSISSIALQLFQISRQSTHKYISTEVEADRSWHQWGMWGGGCLSPGLVPASWGRLSHTFRGSVGQTPPHIQSAFESCVAFFVTLIDGGLRYEFGIYAKTASCDIYKFKKAAGPHSQNKNWLKSMSYFDIYHSICPICSTFAVTFH
jgi:hypothetical protein